MVKKAYLFVGLLLIALVAISFLAHGKAAEAQTATVKPIHHYLYVFPDHTVYVYDIDNSFKLVTQISFPMTDGGRGIIADPAGGFLYLSYHGDGGIHGIGSILKYDLIHKTDCLAEGLSFRHRQWSHHAGWEDDIYARWRGCL